MIRVKWIYITKFNADGTIKKYKAKFVVKGFAHIPGVDYFALVARLDVIKLLLAVVTQMNWRVYQLDVKSAFLNGYLREEIYVKQPGGFVKEGEYDKLYLLKRYSMA